MKYGKISATATALNLLTKYNIQTKICESNHVTVMKQWWLPSKTLAARATETHLLIHRKLKQRHILYCNFLKKGLGWRRH